MDKLLKTTNQAIFRMRSVKLLHSALRYLTGAIMLGVTLMILDKTGLIVIADWTGSGVWHDDAWQNPAAALPSPYPVILLALAGAALVGAYIRSRMLSISRENASLMIDERTGDKERVASALAISDAPQSAFSEVLLSDAHRVCESADIKKLFPLACNTAIKKLSGAALLFLAINAFLPQSDLLGTREEQRKAEDAHKKRTEEVKNMASGLRNLAKQLEQKSQKRKTPSVKLDNLAKRMKELAQKLDKDKKIDTKTAKAMINRLRDKMKAESAKSTSQQRKLAGLKMPRTKRSLMKGLVDKLRANDFKGASETMRRMRRRLMKNKMNKEELKQLKKEMEDLAKQLDDMGLKKLSKEFSSLSKDLQDMQDSQQWDKLEKMRQKLADSLKGLQSQGLDLSKLTDEEKELLKKLQKALAGMEMTEEMLSRMQQAAESGRMRELTAEDLKKMLEQLKKNKGKGDKGNTGENGQMSLLSMPMPGQGQGGGSQGQGRGGNGGRNYGSGHVDGGRVPPEHKAKHDDVRLRAQRLARGEIVGQWFVRGLPPEDAEAKAEYTEAVKSSTTSADAVREKEFVPQEAKNLIRDYQNAIRGIEKSGE